MTAKTNPCPYCTKKFADAWGVYAHAKVKHKGKKLAHLKPNKKEDDEPSMADLMIDAQLNRAMGIRNDDWLEDMLP